MISGAIMAITGNRCQLRLFRWVRGDELLAGEGRVEPRRAVEIDVRGLRQGGGDRPVHGDTDRRSRPGSTRSCGRTTARGTWVPPMISPFAEPMSTISADLADGDPGVPLGHQRVREPDVTARIPADHAGPLGQRELLPRIRSGQHRQRCRRGAPVATGAGEPLAHRGQRHQRARPQAADRQRQVRRQHGALTGCAGTGVHPQAQPGTGGRGGSACARRNSRSGSHRSSAAARSPTVTVASTVAGQVDDRSPGPRERELESHRLLPARRRPRRRNERSDTAARIRRHRLRPLLSPSTAASTSAQNRSASASSRSSGPNTRASARRASSTVDPPIAASRSAAVSVRVRPTDPAVAEIGCHVHDLVPPAGEPVGDHRRLLPAPAPARLEPEHQRDRPAQHQQRNAHPRGDHQDRTQHVAGLRR